MSVSAPLRRLKGAPELATCRTQLGHAGECLGPSWGRYTAVLTVNHGNQRTVGTPAQQPYRLVMRPQVRIWHARGQGRLWSRTCWIAPANGDRRHCPR
jgi:hypothetical protein